MMDEPLQLMVVIPAYNEEACIAEVVQSWLLTLDELGMTYSIAVIDDGSTDGTPLALASFAEDDRVRVTTKTNSGHGPTILGGYRTAVETAEWVFQCDGDNEMASEHFARLWQTRNDYDALFGTRMDRSQSAGRRLISGLSRVVVSLAYARGVQDVNTPYRLMRSTALSPLVSVIPSSTFAPNLVIAGSLAFARARIANIPVPHQNRRTGSGSIVKWRLWSAAARSLVQTIALAPAMRQIARQMAARGPSAKGPQ